MLTCSCTGLVSEEEFLETLRRAAWQAGRTVQVLRIAGPGRTIRFWSMCRKAAISRRFFVECFETGRLGTARTNHIFSQITINFPSRAF